MSAFPRHVSGYEQACFAPNRRIVFGESLAKPCRRPVITTADAPSETMLKAVAWPMPLVAPGTRQTRPLSRPAGFKRKINKRG